MPRLPVSVPVYRPSHCASTLADIGRYGVYVSHERAVSVRNRISINRAYAVPNRHHNFKWGRPYFQVRLHAFFSCIRRHGILSQ